MTWRSTVLNIWQKLSGPALRLRTQSALQIELQFIRPDGSIVYATLGVDPDGSPGLYRNAQLVKQADGSWQWVAVNADQWCSSYHLDSDGRWVFKTVAPSGIAASPLDWGAPKARFEPDGTLVCPAVINKSGW